MTTFRFEGSGHRTSRVLRTLASLTLGVLACSAMAEEAPLLTPGSSEPVVVPSGQTVTLHDVILDAPGPEGPVARYRFLAPAIAGVGGTVGFAEAADDLQHLCDSAVVPDLARQGPLPGRVILSVFDRVVGFGETDPEATQFFTEFQIVDGVCILEPF